MDANAELHELSERQAKRLQILQTNLEESQSKRGLLDAEVKQLTARNAELEGALKKQAEEMNRQSSVLEDLIHNSSMLTDMMLATTRLEERIEELEERIRELEERNSYLTRQLEEKEDEQVEKTIQDSGNSLAQDLQLKLKKERQDTEEMRAKFLEDNETLRSSVSELKTQLRLSDELHKKYKEKIEKDVHEKAQLRNEIVLLKAERLSVSEMSNPGGPADIPEKAGGSGGDDRDEIIAMHSQQRQVLEDKMDGLQLQLQQAKQDIEAEKAKTLNVQREFDLHKIVVRNRDSASAKYKLQLLGRVRTAEKERDDALLRIQQLLAELDGMRNLQMATQEEVSKEKLKAKQSVEEERKKSAEEIERHRKKAMEEIEVEIRRAEEEVERLRKKAEEETERRQKLEALERVRQKAEEENSRRYRVNMAAPFLFNRTGNLFSFAQGLNSARGGGGGMPVPNVGGDDADHAVSDRELTTEELMQEYRKTHGKAAVQIYATDTPDIYIFGTRKIHLIVLDGQLMVRVGGGYATIDDFVEKHAPSEARKMKLALDKAHKEEYEKIQQEQQTRDRKMSLRTSASSNSLLNQAIARPASNLAQTQPIPSPGGALSHARGGAAKKT